MLNIFSFGIGNTKHNCAFDVKIKTKPKQKSYETKIYQQSNNKQTQNIINQMKTTTTTHTQKHTDTKQQKQRPTEPLHVTYWLRTERRKH